MALPCFYDAHNHLQDSALDSCREAFLTEAAALGIRGGVVNGTCENDWALVEQLCSGRPELVPSFGLHPWDAGNRSDGWSASLRTFLARNPRAGVGEVGLDGWILERAKPDDPRLLGLRRAPLEEQVSVFKEQIQLACSLGRALSIHCTDAWGLMHETLRSVSLPRRGFLLHAYSGSAELLPRFVELGAYFSFNGSYLNPKRQRLQEVFRLVPKDRLLVETDCPAMTPPPPWRHPRGEALKLNHPANITAVYAGLGRVLSLGSEELEATCAENFRRLFGE